MASVSRTSSEKKTRGCLDTSMGLFNWFSSGVRCKRDGHHKPHWDYRFGYKRDKYGLLAANAVTARQMRCRRCRDYLSEIETVEEHPVHSLTMYNEQWTTLEAKGIVLVRQWYEPIDNLETKPRSKN